MPHHDGRSRVVLPPSDRDARRIRTARVLSYLLVLLAAVVFSLRPALFGDPHGQPEHALLHVWRIVLGIALVLGAAAVQVVVGFRWRRDLRRRAEDD